MFAVHFYTALGAKQKIISKIFYRWAPHMCTKCNVCCILSPSIGSTEENDLIVLLSRFVCYKHIPKNFDVYFHPVWEQRSKSSPNCSRGISPPVNQMEMSAIYLLCIFTQFLGANLKIISKLLCKGAPNTSAHK